MNSLFSCFVILTIFGQCLSLPVCCQNELYYADFLMNLKCGISLCKTNEEKINSKTIGNLCISCTPKSLPINADNSQGSTSPRISKPHDVCRTLEIRNEFFFGRIMLSWSSFDTKYLPSVYMVEARNSSTTLGEWNFVGMTNETFAEVSNLEILYKYQFRVTAIVSAKSTLLPELSDWMSVKNLLTDIDAPTDVSMTDFTVKENSLEAVVKWNAPKEMPCSYKVYLISPVLGEYLQSRYLILPGDSLSVTFKDLSFEANYTVEIHPQDPSNERSVESAHIWFVTPSCLSVTGGNFKICAPGPPLNVSIKWFPGSLEAVLTWSPPTSTSKNNNVTGYHIVVDEVFGLRQNFIRSRNVLSMGQNYTVATISSLKSSTNYIFEVRAISQGGTGLPAILELDTEDPTVSTMVMFGMPYYYIVPLMIIPVAFAIILALSTLYHCKRRKKHVYPSGVADVDDDIRPFLIPFEKVELKEIVGQGAFGTVHRGIYSRSKSKDEVAVKVYPSITINRHQMLHEVEMLRILGRHENIVGFVGFTLGIEKMCLLFEYCRLGNLHSHLVGLKPELMYMKSIPTSERPSIPNEKGHGVRLSSYIYQVAKGMEYISSLKIVHRDIAARNILMLDEKRIKIGDFGLSKDIYCNKFYSSQTQKKFPIKWMAPEAIEKQKFNIYTDVWSFGVFMWEVFKLGKEPYPAIASANILQYLKMGFRLDKPHCNEPWYKIMQACWHKIPRERPRFRELVCRIESVIDYSTRYLILSQ